MGLLELLLLLDSTGHGNVIDADLSRHAELSVYLTMILYYVCLGI